ncbi:MAG TPA: hypothetical protein VI749_01390 [Candidatus Omnitrophota bacterium]|nr:hypothetical protein [Candidatus Omnitrophota bacterium]
MIELKNKIIIIAATVTFVVIAGLFLMAQPFKKKDPLLEAIQRYRSPADYTSADIRRMVDTMREDPEFQFYFQALRGQQQNQAIDEAIAVLEANRTPASLLERIEESQGHVRGLGATFYHLEYTDEYVKSPGKSPQLEEVFWQFLSEEFKLTVLGVFYKANHDPRFVFQWDPALVLAAQKLREIWTARAGYVAGNLTKK